MKLHQLNEALINSKYIYHVTYTKNVAKIQKQGIKPFHTSNWVKAGTGNRYNEEGGIFAFEHPEDAWKWAFKMQFMDKSKPISIIKLKKTGEWEKDPSEDLMLQLGKGKSLRSIGATKPADFVAAFSLDELGNPSGEGLKNIVNTLADAT